MKQTIKERQRSSTKFAYIYAGGGGHKDIIYEISRTVGADKYEIKMMPLHFISGILYSGYLALKIPSYDTYIVESSMSIFVPWLKRILKKEKNTIIYRGTDSAFYPKDDNYLNTKNPLKKMILLSLFKKIDLVLGDAPLVAESARKLNIKAKFCFSSFSADYEKYIKTKVDIKNKNFFFIGEYRPPYDHKNIRGLIKIFNMLPEEYKLTVIGNRTEQLRKLVEKNNVRILGFVKNIEEYTKKSAFFITLPKYEVGPIAVLEAMMRGQIPIINDKTGIKFLVRKVSKKLIIPSDLSDEEIVKRIKKICSMDLENRMKLSKRARKIASSYSKENVMKKVRKTLLKGALNE